MGCQLFTLHATVAKCQTGSQIWLSSLNLCRASQWKDMQTSTRRETSSECQHHMDLQEVDLFSALRPLSHDLFSLSCCYHMKWTEFCFWLFALILFSCQKNITPSPDDLFCLENDMVGARAVDVSGWPWKCSTRVFAVTNLNWGGALCLPRHNINHWLCHRDARVVWRRQCQKKQNMSQTHRKNQKKRSMPWAQHKNQKHECLSCIDQLGMSECQSRMLVLVLKHKMLQISSVLLWQRCNFIRDPVHESRLCPEFWTQNCCASQGTRCNNQNWTIEGNEELSRHVLSQCCVFPRACGKTSMLQWLKHVHHVSNRANEDVDLVGAVEQNMDCFCCCVVLMTFKFAWKKHPFFWWNIWWNIRVRKFLFKALSLHFVPCLLSNWGWRIVICQLKTDSRLLTAWPTSHWGELILEAGPCEPCRHKLVS